jgi:hypothetical protein
VAVLVLAFSGALSTGAFAERQLVRVEAPEHDPLYVDRASVRRTGSTVQFNYVLDVLAVAEGRSVPGGWKSNEIEATIDCAGSTFSGGKLTAYAAPRAGGAIAGSYTPTAAERKPVKIEPKSTDAYLAAFVCANR